MAVPKFDEMFRPILEALSDGEARRSKQLQAAVISYFSLTEDDLADMIPSGKKTRVYDRVEWASTFLRQARLIESIGRGVNRITQRGRDFLATTTGVIKPDDLNRFPEYVEFKNRSRSAPVVGPGLSATDGATPPESATPEEELDAAFNEINDSLVTELLDRIKEMPPAFFEQLIVQLMMKLGYGGAFGVGKSIGRTADGGVDGVISQDKLGLEKIYLQAKRWGDGTVGSKEVQAFVGALSGQGATKGVFVTTSDFSANARSYVDRQHNFKLSLVNGRELAKLMIENDLGVTLVQRYDVKRIDSDFFTAE
jgi:restriction system protein